MHESKLDESTREIVGVIDQGIAIDLFGLGPREIRDIRGNGGPGRRRVIPLVQFDGMFVFAVVVSVQMQTDRGSRDCFIAPKLEAIVKARRVTHFLNDELGTIV